MRKLVLAATAAMALVGAATAANASSTLQQPTPNALTPPDSAFFGADVDSGPTSFDDTYTFSIAGSAGVTDAQVSTLLLNKSQNINFTSVVLDGTYSFSKTSTDPAPETWALLSPVLLDVGTHSIEVVGNLIGPTGSYSGTINVQAPVPEAKTWMMMLLGFGGMGFALRRRQRPVLAQIA
ncbi:MAG TPA: FxDxF family PEP-CTERM protein [Sphingomicrobium sp.]|nr:FxDxF family PEP-CTERM protein [Sphingomicrobium sp.]